MSDKVFIDFWNSKNFQIGVGLNIVIVDVGVVRDFSILIGKVDVYVMIFDQKGLMVGVGLQGLKIIQFKN